MSYRRFLHLVLFASACALSGCGSGTAVPFYPKNDNGGITYALSSGGQSIAMNAAGQAVTLTIASTGGAYTVASANPSVASVTPSGSNVYTIESVAAGTTTIVVSTATGSVSIPVVVTVTSGIVETRLR